MFRIPDLDLTIEESADILLDYQKIYNTGARWNQLNVTCPPDLMNQNSFHQLQYLCGINWDRQVGTAPTKEEEFTEIVDRLKNTTTAKIVERVKSKYSIGRVRFLTLPTHYSYGWDKEARHTRLHFPLQTNIGAIYVWEDTVNKTLHAARMNEIGHAYLVPANRPHTTFNASTSEDRVHLTFNILSPIQ